MHSITKVKAHASALRDVLNELGHPLKHSQCLEIISKTEGHADWNTFSAEINIKQERAERFFDDMLEGERELSYKKFTQHFEEKYLVGFTEASFLKGMENIRDDEGNYERREYMGCLAVEKVPDDDRYPNHLKYVWRGYFDKGEVLITMGVYQKGGTYHVSGFRYR